MISAVIIAGAGEKAFCAGGDVAAVALSNKQGADGRAEATHYFGLEYTLDHLIATYTQPYIAYMDGITMGGGVGLSVHAPLRIATERTVFAMPETTIGFFPDVGASFFLPRLDGALGAYLALTSARLDGANAYYAGVATHFLHSTALPDLTARIAELVFKDDEMPEQRLRHLDAAIAEFDSGLPENQPWRYRGKLRAAIDRCFAPETLGGMVEALCAEREGKDAELATWATETLETLAQRSPTSLHVTVKQLAIAARYHWSVAYTFRREYGMAKRFLSHPDFNEGVLARLVEKRTPKWDPEDVDAVRPQDMDEFFTDEGEELPLLSDKDYPEYPHSAYSWLGLPSERDVRDYVKGGGKEVMKHFSKSRLGKPGIMEKLEDIMRRKVESKKGELEWVD